MALATGCCALALVACGSAGKPAATDGASDYAAALKFSQCMRSHGVPSFPDPVPGSGGGKVATPVGISPQSPAFQSAQQSCHKLLPGGGPPTSVPESVKLAALKFAQCMRAHGVPSYPDPTFRGGARIEKPLFTYGINPDSPVVQNAEKVCGESG